MPSLVKSSWAEAAALLARWLGARERIDRLMDEVPEGLIGAERARCQRLVFGVVRHFGRLEAAVSRQMAHLPRFSTRAVLYLAGFELMEAGEGGPPDAGRVAKIVHHAVEQAKALSSPAEARMVNAVARRLASELAAQPAPAPDAGPGALAEHYSHPEWLVRRWGDLFGPGPARALLEWNQRPAPVFARWRGPGEPPPWFGLTAWPGFHEVPHGRWSEVEGLARSGSVYLQDPSTRLAVELLDPRPDETVLDACAAPGGKSLMIADAMGRGRVVALDLPGERQRLLRENAGRASGARVVPAAGDLRQAPSRWIVAEPLPDQYPAVLLDAPCSNTGVMRHRIDVKWRLRPGDFRRQAAQQLELLAAAAGRVAPGGRLVYSTCSVDPEENEGVIAAFLRGPGRAFSLQGSRLARPWTEGHDGAGVFLLKGRTD